MDPLHGFTPALLDKKLKELNSTLQSIQATCQWLIHHRKHAKTIIKIWYKEMQKAVPCHKLTLLYLANDVIQNSKRKGPEYRAEFVKVLPRAFQLVSREKDNNLQRSVERVVNVWEERKVFSGEVIIRLKSLLVAGTLKPRRTKSESGVKHSAAASILPEAKRSKVGKKNEGEDEPPNDRKPPEPEELLRRMQAIDGDHSAARDMATRKKIANLPDAVHNSTLLSDIKDRESAESLSKKVEEASTLLVNYNKRLADELKERKEIQELLDAYIWQQIYLLRSAKKRLKEYQDKMERVSAVKEELKFHLASLPDFTQIPMKRTNAGSLAPLPTVGDLFN